MATKTAVTLFYKMKKAAIIFLLFIYALSATGFAVKADYCCSTLKSVKLILADGAKDKDGCCTVKYQSFKIKDAHSAADVLTAPVAHFTFIHTLNTSPAAVDFSCGEHNEIINIHSPPLHSATPVYIFDYTFRI
jgi:hypothetical protein